MKIAIYDIIHIEQVLPLLKVADHLKLSLALFTNESFKADISRAYLNDNPDIRIYYKQADQKEYGFMQKARDIIRDGKYRVFLLNSIDSKHLLWSWIINSLPDAIIINTLHEINNLFEEHLPLHPKKLIRQLGKREFRKGITAYTVNTYSLKSNIEKRRLTDKKIWLLPQAIFDESLISVPANDGEFQIVIPGSIDLRRRNYQFALDVYEKILRGSQVLPRLVIAGAPMGEYGQEIIKRAEKINLEGGKISYSLNNIPEEEFDRIINNSHLLFSPQLHRTSISDGIAEWYGETKNSGNTHLALRLARPMLIPTGLKTALEDQKSIVYYSNADQCASIIIELIRKPELLTQLQDEAKKESRNFSVSVIAEKFRDILNFYSEV